MTERTERRGRTLRFRKSRAIAYTLFAGNVAAYAASLFGAVFADAPWLATLLAIVNGVTVALLFVVGHDCCHGSFLPTRRENYLVGQICFLPSLHPFSLWALGHNQIHHRYTNLATKDYVYTPLSVQQYAALSRFERWSYRFHRTVAGHVTYYWTQIWWTKMFFPRRSEVGPYRREYSRDMAIVAAWLVVLLGGLGWIAKDHAWAGPIWFGFGIPMLVWGILMSAVIYLHHTHPSVKWYASEAEWKSDASQLESTVHISFPLGLNVLFHRIMEHNAHHMRPNIPMYHLKEAQSVMAPEARSEKWTLRRHIEITRICRLYDFEEGLWRDYDGKRVPVEKPQLAAQ